MKLRIANRRRPRRAAVTIWTALALALGGTATAVGAAHTVDAQKLTAWNAAATICSGTQTFTRLATGDTYADQSSANQNYGTSSDLFVRSKSGNQDRRTFVAFTLPAAPSGCTLKSAQLRLSNTSGTSGRTIDVYRAASSWTETGLTWSNQPATSGTAVGTASSSSSGWRTWDVLDHVQAMYSSGVNDGFVVRDRTEGDSTSPEQKYASREHTDDPQLVLTFE